MREIYLHEICSEILDNYKIIIISLLISVAIGISYIFIVHPIYKVNIHMLPPTITSLKPVYIVLSEINDLENNDQNIDKELFDSKTIFDLAIANLRSHELQNEYLKNMELKHELIRAFPNTSLKEINGFVTDKNYRIVIKQYVKKRPERYHATISFYTKYPQLSDYVLQKYISSIDQLTAKNISEVINSKIEHVKQKIINEKNKLKKINHDTDNIYSELEYKLEQINSIKIEPDAINTIRIDLSDSAKYIKIWPDNLRILLIACITGVFIGFSFIAISKKYK